VLLCHADILSLEVSGIRGEVHYEFRDLDGNPLTRAEAAALARTLRVPADVRRRSRAHSIAVHRGRLTR
jgi:hypothetical protein